MRSTKNPSGSTKASVVSPSERRWKLRARVRAAAYRSGWGGRGRQRVTGIRGGPKEQHAGRDTSILIRRQRAGPQHLNRRGDTVGACLHVLGIGLPVQER